MFEPKQAAQGILIATGSEVQLAVMAAKELEKENTFMRVVSMPCCERFKKQDESYREKILPKKITRRLAIEAGVPDYWYQFADDVMGITTFGASAPEKDIWKAFGFTYQSVMSRARKQAVFSLPRA